MAAVGETAGVGPVPERVGDRSADDHTAQRDVNFEHSDVDAAILIGQPGETRLHYDHLFDCYLSPVCSPAYLERHGAITLPGDLSTHMLLQVYPSARDWQVWLDANQADGIYCLAFSACQQEIS